MGSVIAQRPEQYGTTAKTSECQRADPKKLGVQGATPPALFPPAFSGESRAPARSRAGTHVAGPTLWRARKAHKKHPQPGIRRGLSHIVDGTRAAGSGLPLTQTQPAPGPCREPSPLQCSGGCLCFHLCSTPTKRMPRISGRPCQEVNTASFRQKITSRPITALGSTVPR